MTDKPSQDSGKKEMWGCIGTVAAALITGIITLIVAGKFPFISPTPTLTHTVTVTQMPTATTEPSQFPSPTVSLIAQEVQWIPDNDGSGTAGLCINEWNQTSRGPVCPNKDNFVSWNIVKSELEQQVLPQVSNIPSSSTLRLKNGPNGEVNWIIQVIDPYGNEIANVWIGNDPLISWKYDGLIRIGYPYNPVDVWATFVRYSDNSYRKELSDNRTQQSVPDDHRDNAYLRYASAGSFLALSFFYSQAESTAAQSSTNANRWHAPCKMRVKKRNGR